MTYQVARQCPECGTEAIPDAAKLQAVVDAANHLRTSDPRDGDDIEVAYDELVVALDVLAGWK